MRDTMDKIERFIEKYYYIILGIIMLLGIFNLFHNLGKFPLADFDEARHGVNAYEMLKKSNFIVNTYGYQNDYYNLKPPLSYWAIMVGYKLFGFNALGLRAYSALSALITIIITIAFVKYKQGKFASIITALAFVTASQFILSHSARTGDADAIYVLFTTIALISMLLMEENINWLYLSGFSFSLAFLAKSWHALVIVAIVGLYMLISRIFFKLKAKNWLIFILCTFLPLIIWGLLRYSYDGFTFFKGMINYDLLARTATPLEGHHEVIYYYIKVLGYFYRYWVLIIIIAAGYAFLRGIRTDRNSRMQDIGLILWILIPLILFTAAKTKLQWYIICIYPPLAIYAGQVSAAVLKDKRSKTVIKVLIALLIAFSTLNNEFFIEKTITNVEPNAVQEVLAQLKGNINYKGKDIYTECGTYQGKEVWDQSQFLAAEYSDDLMDKNGGLGAFMKDSSSNALLLLPKDNSGSQVISSNKLKVVVQSDTNYIVTK